MLLWKISAGEKSILIKRCKCCHKNSRSLNSNLIIIPINLNSAITTQLNIIISFVEIKKKIAKLIATSWNCSKVTSASCQPRPLNDPYKWMTRRNRRGNLRHLGTWKRGEESSPRDTPEIVTYIEFWSLLAKFKLKCIVHSGDYGVNAPWASNPPSRRIIIPREFITKAKKTRRVSLLYFCPSTRVLLLFLFFHPVFFVRFICFARL